MLGFFQVEDKSIQRGEHHYKFGHVESFNYAVWEIFGLVQASRRERDGTYETCSPSHYVFATSLALTVQLHIKRSNS